MLNSNRYNRTNREAYLLPVSELLAIEGWRIRFAPQDDGSTVLRAEKRDIAERWTIRAANEDEAIEDLARKTGWKTCN